MADIGEALDAALSRHYPWGEPKSPASSTRGLQARIRHLEQAMGGRRQAAKAAGIGLSSWDFWKARTRKPSPANLRKLEAAYARLVVRPKVLAKVAKKGTPTRVTVTAEVRWTDSPRKMYNRTKQRTVKLEGLRMGRVVRAWLAAGPQAAGIALQEAAARAYQVNEIGFEGDNVEVKFP